MMNADSVVIGNSLSALVAATELERLGHEVTIVKPPGPWGGYFSGVRAHDQTFDAGMVMLEFTAFAAQAGLGEIESYDPLVRNDIGRFASVVRDWAHARFSTREIAPLSMWVAGATLPDLIMGNDLDALAQLPFAESALIDLRSARPAGDLHASQKARGPAFEACEFEVASRANHGNTLHDRLMAPFLEKVMAPHAQYVLARYHRIPWLPLYWPETLASVLAGAPAPFTASPLAYPVDTTVADVVSLLAPPLVASPRVRLIDQWPIGFKPSGRGGRLTFSDGATIEARHVAWAHSASTLIEALGEEAPSPELRRVPLALALFNVPSTSIRSAFSVLQVVDPGFVLYRITDLTACAGGSETPRKWVVEFNLHVFEARYGPGHSDESILELTADEIHKLGLVSEPGEMVTLAVRRIPGGFAVPDRESLDAWTQDRKIIDANAPAISLMGPASGFMVTSFNDQVVQGLKFARQVDAGHPH